MVVTLPCKVKRQYLLTLQVSRYCLLVLQNQAAPGSYLSETTIYLSQNLNSTYLVATNAAYFPFSFITHSASYAHRCYSSGLCDNNVAVLIFFNIVIQNVLWNLCGFAAPSIPNNYSCLVAFYSLYNLNKNSK